MTPMLDTITLCDLEVRYRVGVPDAERAHPQRLLLTIELDLDVAPSARTDDLNLTINYFAVSRRLLGLGDGREWRLIETLAEEIAGLLLTEYPAQAVRVEVKKFILPETRHVSVRVARSRGC